MKFDVRFWGRLLPLISLSSFLPLTLILAQVNIVCTDSDNGKNLAVKGAITLKSYQARQLVKEQSYQDFFSGTRNRYLEFYCNGNQPAYEIVSCPNEELGKNCPVIPALAAEPKIEVRSLTPIFPEILTPGIRDFPVLNFSLKAYDGAVYLKGLHFVLEDPDSLSTTGVTLKEIQSATLYTFKLYDDQDHLLSQTTSQAGRIYFDLSKRFYSLDGVRSFMVKIDLPKVETVADSWRWFRLSLDKSYLGKGIQAESQDTGNFVEGVVSGQIENWPSSALFVNATTKISVRPAIEQPPLVTAGLGGQEFYHFSVIAHTAGPAQIEQVTLQVSLYGMEFKDNPEGRVFLVTENGTVDFKNPVVDLVSVRPINQSNREAIVTIDFKNQLVLAGETKTYALFLNRTSLVNTTEKKAYTFTILTDNQKSTTRESRLLKSASNLVWSDFPGISEVNRFMRGFLLPIDTQTKVFY